MDMQQIINILIGIVMSGLGWFGKALWDAVGELRKNVHKIEVDLPANYIRKDEFKSEIKEVKDILGKIFDRLESKADK
jgi:hypothetical protein